MPSSNGVTEGCRLAIFGMKTQRRDAGPGRDEIVSRPDAESQ
jgi:hypothetical protein